LQELFLRIVLPEVLTEQSPPYRIDPNGIPILPGYRPPITSAIAKEWSIKGVAARKRYALARKGLAKSIIPSAIISTASLDIACLISATLRAHRRCLAAAMASTDGRQAASWMKAARDAFDCWQSLLGHGPSTRKRGSKPHLASVGEVKPLESPAAPISPEAPQPVNPDSVSSDAPKAGPVA
jgi:hypothetical protein